MQSDRSLNRPTEMLLDLVRAALWKSAADQRTFKGVSREDWTQVLRLASRGGVTALAFEGAVGLPEELRPSRDLLLGWGVNAHRLADRYRRQEETAGELARRLGERSVRMMVLKGLGTARYYPQPSLRECGDIDIWLFGRWEDGNRFARENGLEVENHNAKHSVFAFRGTPVENHRTFLDETLYAMDRRLDRELGSILQQNPCQEAQIGEGEVFFPPADFDALFLARHTAMHFTAGLSLRHLTDWACFLDTQSGRLDAPAFRRRLQREGLERFTGALTAAACLYLGLREEKAPMSPAPHREDAVRLFDTLLGEKKEIKSRNPLSVVAFKTRRFLADQRRYRMVYGRFSFPHRVELSVKSHLKHPETILGNRIKFRKK